jgi:hypothetical protein
MDDRVALSWIFKQCGTASSSVKSTSMEISDAFEFFQMGARLENLMIEDCPSETALRVAMRRAAHQILDDPN